MCHCVILMKQGICLTNMTGMRGYSNCTYFVQNARGREKICEEGDCHCLHNGFCDFPFPQVNSHNLATRLRSP